MLRCAATSMGVTLAGCLAFGGCVDPRTDYNDFLTRTADARAAANDTDSGPIEAEAPMAAFQGTYVMACLSSSLGGNPADALLFVASLKFTPSSGGGGTLQYNHAPLVAHATDVSQTAGPWVFPTDMPKTVQVAANGLAQVDLGPGSVPASANGATGQEIDFSTSLLDLIVAANPASPDGVQICAGEEGQTTAPISQTLSKEENPCIYRPAMPFPTFDSASEFVCF